MDFTYLVYTSIMGAIKKTIYWPALHYVLIGTLIFVVWSSDWVRTRQADIQTNLVIPASRIERMKQSLVRSSNEALSADQEAEIMRTVVNQELLYQYALNLNLLREPVVQRRLAQIASFVAADAPGAKTKSLEEQAEEAIALGLHRSDMVVRRILINSVKRLIKAPIRMRQPTEDAIETYWRTHQDKFRQPAVFRIRHVELNYARHGNETEARAHTVLDQLRTQAISPEDSAHLSDPSFISLNLPLLTERELARRFGYPFADRITQLDPGSWQGPVASNYGMHLVFIQEHHPAHPKPLAQVRNKVRDDVIEQIANKWMKIRLDQLRSQYEEIIIEG